MLGGIYDMAITLADLYIAEANPELLFDKTTPQKYPLTKFAYTNTNNVQKAPVFYEASNTFEKVVNAVKKSSAEGDKKTLDKIMTDPELMKQYEYAKPLRQYRDDISQIRKAIANLRFQDIPIAEKEAKAKLKDVQAAEAAAKAAETAHKNAVAHAKGQATLAA